MKRTYPHRLLQAALFLSLSSASAEVTFTKVGAGAIGEDALHSQSLAWGDYDGDGNVDLFVGFNTYPSKTASEPHRLYHNNGDGTFTRVLDGGIADDMDDSYASGAAWADFENDGDLDLFVAQNENLMDVSTSRLYLNNGDGTFVRSSMDWINEDFPAVDAAWVDVDADGLLDLAVTGLYEVILYHHQPDGSMVRTKIAEFYDRHYSVFRWSDYDNDNDLDLFVANSDAIYRNDGGTFTPDPWEGVQGSLSWSLGDYDNDGDPDLFKGHFRGSKFRLFENNGDSTWTPVYSGIITGDELGYRPSSWADYDNDGYLDLFIPATSDPSRDWEGTPMDDPNLLFHNNGDGTFTRVDVGQLTSDSDLGMSFAAGWADYDNDGDLDLVLSDGQNMQAGPPPYFQLPAVPAALYRNDGGNENNWLLLTLEGTTSNRSAIGTKVFATATINGVQMTQLREVGSGQGSYAGCDTRVHFGLGDAAQVDTLRIEWPSGWDQTLGDVEPNQILTISEGWAGYPLHQGFHVYTGGWMGWLYVEMEPWAWCYNTACWFYIPETVAETGSGWLYIPGLTFNTPELWLMMIPDTAWGWSYGLSKWIYVDPTGSGWVYLIG